MTIPYTELTHNQLLSAITERDEQLRVALGDDDDWDFIVSLPTDQAKSQ